ncbi:MAG: AAA family ATPase [Candidatus Dormibacteraeota bacterium]|nr:AAA family ATPase [Candidatus Dormibacteraeota bacterium]
MLLGREAERSRIDTILADARTGTSAALLLRGEAGIGKTALLRYAVEQAATSMRVLSARGVQFEADIPFAGLHELLQPAFGMLDRLPGHQAATLQGALGRGPRVQADRLLLGAATLGLLSVYADEAPLLLVIDDAHWLDRSSAEAIGFAVRRLLADPIATLISVRDGEDTPLLEVGLPELVVTGLDPASARGLLDVRTSAPVERDTFEWILRATAGNPLALVELADAAPHLSRPTFDLPLPVTTTVERTFLRRAVSLSAPARRALLIAAALQPADLDMVRRAALSMGLPMEAIDEAEAAAGLVQSHAGVLEFRHPLARSAIYNAASPADRRGAHRAVAGVLTSSEQADRRAWHLASASQGPDEEVAAALEGAGGRARERSAYAAAATAFEHSARLGDDGQRRSERLFRAGEAAWLAGRVERAVESLEGARRLSSGPELRAEIDQLRGHLAMRRGAIEEGYQMLVEAAAATQGFDRGKAVLMLADAALGSLMAGRAVDSLAAGRRALELVRGDEAPDIAFYAHVAYGIAAVVAGHGAEGSAHLRTALGLFERASAGVSSPLLLVWATFVPMFLREAETGREMIASAVELARDEGPSGALPVLLHYLGRDAATTDRWALARARYEEAIRIAREAGQSADLASSLAGIAWLDAREGRVEQCLAHGQEALALTEQLGLDLFRVWALTALAELELGQGRISNALEPLLECQRVLDRLGLLDADLAPGPELVDAYLRLGRPDDARLAAERYYPLALEKGQPWSLARAARCQGLLADEDGFVDRFEEALRRHRQTPDTFEQARTELFYGERLRRARRRTASREQLRSAFRAFEQLGAVPWAERAAAELNATGESARRRDVSTLDLLTPQELQIAHALAEGRTTREAAAKLYLSPKTVEYHLRNVYSKLEIRSRDELREALQRLER